MKSDQPTPEGLRAAAWMLNVEEATLRAIAEVEAGSEGAFLESGEPVILFERHVFSRLTSRIYDAIAPDLSNPIRGGYGKLSDQHSRLDRAAKLGGGAARTAALKSASWGLFQIMGENHKQAGFPSLQSFVNAMYESADAHLRALVMLIRSSDQMLDAMQRRDWLAFAYLYNGPAFKENRYDARMAQAYGRIINA